jgi:hypothetical protein
MGGCPALLQRALKAVLRLHLPALRQQRHALGVVLLHARLLPGGPATVTTLNVHQRKRLYRRRAPEGGAWHKAAAHVSRLRRTAITQYFPRTGHVKSMTGIHSHSHSPLTPPLPSTHKPQHPHTHPAKARAHRCVWKRGSAVAYGGGWG